MRERKREGERERQYRLKPRQKSSRFYSLDLILHFFIVNRPRFVAHLHINASVSLSQISETWNIFENYFRPGGSEECYERGEKFRSFSFPRWENFSRIQRQRFSRNRCTLVFLLFFFLEYLIKRDSFYCVIELNIWCLQNHKNDFNRSIKRISFFVFHHYLSSSSLVFLYQVKEN